jgi:hypothetical protein
MEAQIENDSTGKSFNGEILSLRRRLLVIHSYYEQLLDLFDAMLENEADLFQPKNLYHFRTARDKIAVFRQHAAASGQPRAGAGGVHGRAGLQRKPHHEGVYGGDDRVSAAHADRPLEWHELQIHAGAREPVPLSGGDPAERARRGAQPDLLQAKTAFVSEQIPHGAVEPAARMC